jgi:phosphotriesterase-related protein
MNAMTVLGPVEPEALGVTLAHEHLLIDLRNQYTAPDGPERRRLGEQPLGPANVGEVRRNPYAIRDNLLLDDVELAGREINEFRKLGGATVVDCTSLGIGRSAQSLREIARRTGLNVIAGCGYYTRDTHPVDMPGRSAEALAEEMVRDLTVGIDGGDIRAGVIGEIGTSRTILPDEEKNLRAAAIAHRKTGAAVYVHTYPWGRTGLEAAAILTRGGVPPERIVICHIDVEIRLDYIRELLAAGVFVEFDDFGKEFFPDSAGREGFAGGAFARDTERAAAVAQLVRQGYQRRILVANDICLKVMLRQYGGRGYGHILNRVLPMLVREGIDPAAAHSLLTDNPARLLCG